MEVSMSKSRTKVAVIKMTNPDYQCYTPYHPSTEYPEYPFPGHIKNGENEVYHSVRQLLFELGLDAGRYGTAKWNPLGHLIKPGMTVVIKPNFVLSNHVEKENIFSIITHPSVLRSVVDYCWIAL